MNLSRSLMMEFRGDFFFLSSQIMFITLYSLSHSGWTKRTEIQFQAFDLQRTSADLSRFLCILIFGQISLVWLFFCLSNVRIWGVLFLDLREFFCFVCFCFFNTHYELLAIIALFL